MQTESWIPIVLIGLLVMQTAFLGLLLLRINALDQNLQAMYALFTLNTGISNLVEDVVENMSADDSPYRGSPNASVTIMEFSDFTCPACRDVQPVLNELLTRYEGQIILVYRYFPVGSDEAFMAATAAECAAQQGAFWEMHDILFANQDALHKVDLLKYASGLGLNRTLFTTCLMSEEAQTQVRNDIIVGQSYGVNAIPTFFVNGRKVSGTLPVSVFEALIEEMLGY